MILAASLMLVVVVMAGREVITASTQMSLAFFPSAMATGAFICSGVGAWGATAVGRPILHIGLTIMAAGTVVLWLSLRPAHQTVGTLSLIPRISPEPREHPAWGRRTPRLTGLRPHASAPSPKLITERDRLPDGKTRGQPPFCTQSLACWGVVCTALNRHYVASGSAAWQRGQAW